MPSRPVWKRLVTDPWVYVLVTLSIIGISLAYQRTEPYRIALESHRDDFLSEGFHDPERNTSGGFRWTDARADVYFPNLWPSQPVRLSLVLSAPRPTPQSAPVPVVVNVNGQTVATLNVGVSAQRYDFALNADMLGASGNLYLTLRSPTFSPPNDTRQLALMISALEVTPTGQPPFGPALPVLLTLSAVVALSYVWLRRLAVSRGIAVTVGLALIAVAVLGLSFARLLVTPFNARVLYTLVVAFVGSEVTVWLGGYRHDWRAHRWTALLFLAAFAVRMIFAHSAGDEANFIAFKLMIAQIAQHGLVSIYELDPVVGAYPPFHHYDLALVGWLYQSFVSPEFYVASSRLNFMMKMPTIVLDMAITVVIMVYAARRRNAPKALLIGAFYALNLGVIYTTAYNGQLGDPLYVLCVVLAVVSLLTEQAAAFGIAAALAILTKPQASAFLPFLLVAGLCCLTRHTNLSLRGAERHSNLDEEIATYKPLARALVAAAVTGLIVIAPFVLAGTLPQMLRTVSTTIGHGPRISANAYNIWWLLGWGNAWDIKDTETVFGIVSYRTMGLVLFFVVANGLAAWQMWMGCQPARMARLAAFVALAFFMLPTEIHENYLFAALPLLALWAAHERRAWLVGGVLTATWFANLVIVDVGIMDALTGMWPNAASLIFPTQVTASLLNVTMLVLLAWWIVREGRVTSA